jgi:hypothetical protein
MRCSPRSAAPPAAPPAALLLAAVAAVMPAAVRAQAPAKPRTKTVSPAEIKRLDAKLDSLRESFFRDTTTLIKGYEDAGQPERAKVLLEALGRLDPTNDLIKQRLSELQTLILDGQEFEIEIDPGTSWQPIGRVTKDQMLRIRVSGEYTCKVDVTSGPDGLPTANPAEDIVGTVPLGAMMGVITSGDTERGDKPPKPFAIGTEYTRPAAGDGLLLLKANLPPKSKCIGRLVVKVSGASRPQ